MRLALGAGRRRLIKQLFTEGLLLSLIAALGGIAVAYWSRNALVLAFPPSVPGITIDYPGQMDWRVLLLSVAVCIGSTTAFRARAGDSIEPCRSFRRAQKRRWRRGWRQRAIAITLGSGAGPGLAQFCSPRRHRIAFAKPAANAKRQSRFLQPTM